MKYARAIGATALVCCQLSLAPGQALAQSRSTSQSKADEERVDIIVSQPDPDRRGSLRRFFSGVKARIAQVTGHALPMTRCEKWSVAKKDLEKVKKQAAKNGVVITQLGADWEQLMRVSEEAQLDDKQKAMVERAKASKSTLGVKIMVAPPPAVLEHALTADIKNPDGTSQPAKITVGFTNNTTITIVRTSVDIKPDMCIWRGTVEGTESQVTFMWWANGKMTGTVQGEGKPKSIRHLGGRLYAVVEMGEDRMPQEHAPMAQRGDTTLQDDPLVQQGDPSSAAGRRRRQRSPNPRRRRSRRRHRPSRPPPSARTSPST